MNFASSHVPLPPPPSSPPPPPPPPSPLARPLSRRLVVLGAPRALLRRMECSGCAAVAAGVDLSRSSSPRARRVMKRTHATDAAYAYARTQRDTRVTRVRELFVALFFFPAAMPPLLWHSRGYEITRPVNSCLSRVATPNGILSSPLRFNCVAFPLSIAMFLNRRTRAARVLNLCRFNFQ